MYGVIQSETPQYFVGNTALDYKRDKMQVNPLFSSGECISFLCCWFPSNPVNDREAMFKIIEYATTYSLSSKYEEHPFFFIENPFITKKMRETFLAIFMEQCSFPACYFSKASSCLAYLLWTVSKAEGPSFLYLWYGQEHGSDDWYGCLRDSNYPCLWRLFLER